MMEFKSVPGYDPRDYRNESNWGKKIRRWHPLVLGFLILLAHFEWMPIWFSVIPQILIIGISALSLFGMCFAVVVLKILTEPVSDDYVHPLKDGVHQLEFLASFVLCIMIYNVNWPITLAAYAGVIFASIALHLAVMVNQSKHKKG